MDNLIIKANKLYNLTMTRDFIESIDLYIEFFTLAELKQLWQACQADLDLAFDDEIFEALKQLKQL
ncbi:MAG: hypothetical protein DRJ15_16170 [Bacteroidetes bacterium]|nr:MAG: hypothetical protein DRJ15_16170 [Bacteroidota bacterium]